VRKSRQNVLPFEPERAAEVARLAGTEPVMIGRGGAVVLVHQDPRLDAWPGRRLCLSEGGLETLAASASTQISTPVLLRRRRPTVRRFV